MPELILVYMVLSFGVGMGSFLAWYACRHGVGRESRLFMLMMLSLALYSFLIIMELAGSSISYKVFWSKTQYLLLPHVPPLWFLFAAGYGGFDRWFSRWRIGFLWLLPLAVILLAMTNEWHGLIWRDIYRDMIAVDGRVIYVHGPAVWVFAIYSYVLLLTGSAMLLLATYRSARLYQSQRVALILAALAPMIGNLLYLSGLSPLKGIDLAPIIFAVAGIMLAWALFRLRFLQVLPVPYDAVLEGMQEGVIMINAQGRIAGLNHAAQRLLGLSPESIGAPIEEALEHWPDLLPLSEDTFEISCKAGNGPAPELRCIEASISACHDKRPPKHGWLLLIRDVSERKRTEEARRRLDMQMQQAQKIESLGMLAGGIAHDFNNMFMTIHGNIELVKLNMPKEDPGYELLENACAMIIRASGIAGQMMAYAGHGRVSLATENLTDLMISLDPMIRIGVPDAIRIECQLADGLPPIKAAAVQIRQVVMNLMRNAVEAITGEPEQSTENSGTILFTTGVLNVDRHFLETPHLYGDLREGRYVFLRVKDSGCGMEAVVLERIFDPFYTSKFIGRGLGLAATLGIMRAHGGIIHVETKAGQGSAFTLLFPAMDDPV